MDEALDTFRPVICVVLIVMACCLVEILCQAAAGIRDLWRKHKKGKQ